MIAGTVQLTGVRATVQPDGRVKIHFSLSPPTLVAEVTIKNEAGQVVRILKQQRGPVAFWDRKDERGQPVPPGKYTIEVTAKQRTEFTTSQVNASVVINLK
ncbi:MAG TPA: hypothetical protein EYP85_11720 [Armatimonadetes bacterium]|nr:hypothetical protein [Armatimonadota bacterium]